MEKRTFKFYRKNEEEVMLSLGLQPTKNSGSGWIEKEDGQNEYVICQLKSTDAQSIKINQKDIRVLEKNARVEHKLPLFAIQFLNTNEVWLLARPEEFSDIAQYITTGSCEKPETIEFEETSVKVKKKICSSEDARKAFNEEREKKYKKVKSAK